MMPYYDRDGITVFCGDCRDVLPTLEPGSVDLVLTDPPYAVSNKGMWHYRRPGKGKRRFDFFEGDADWKAMIELTQDVAGLTLPLLTSIGSAYWWVGHREFGHIVTFYEGNGWKTRFLVWVKAAPSPPPPGSGWPSGAELCVYAFRAGRTWTHKGENPPPNNVFRADSFRYGQPGKVKHPTQKPFKVISPLILASSLPGQLVLDPFAGSLTTAVAAKLLGRRCICIEKEEMYCEEGVKRLSQGVFPCAAEAADQWSRDAARASLLTPQARMEL